MSTMPENRTNDRSDMCDAIDDLLEGYAFGALEPDEMLLVADRINGCPEQLIRLQQYEETVGMIGMSIPPVQVPERVWYRLQAATAAIASPEPVSITQRTRSVLVVPKWAAGLAAAMLLLLVGASISLGVALQRNDEPDDSFESTMAYYMTSGATVIPLSSKAIPEYESWNGKGALVVMADMPPLLIVDNCEPARDGASYVVWVAVNGDRTGMGQLSVGEDGRGMMQLENMGPLDGYDLIGVSWKTNDDQVFDLIEGAPRQEG